MGRRSLSKSKKLLQLSKWKQFVIFCCNFLQFSYHSCTFHIICIINSSAHDTFTSCRSYNTDTQICHSSKNIRLQGLKKSRFLSHRFNSRNQISVIRYMSRNCFCCNVITHLRRHLIKRSSVHAYNIICLIEIKSRFICHILHTKPINTRLTDVDTNKSKCLSAALNRLTYHICV